LINDQLEDFVRKDWHLGEVIEGAVDGEQCEDLRVAETEDASRRSPRTGLKS